MKRRGDYPLTYLGGLTAREFISEYWQKKPLFVKGAFPQFKAALSIEELAGLALEEEIPSRLILEEGGSKPWELRQGPFTDEDFAQFPNERWMLMLNDLDKYIPDLAPILEPFRFIPRWRFDDLQASIAVDGGNVGPHWDDYDVFLLQGEGRKRWQISYAPTTDEDFIPGVDLRLIENFKVDEEWVVEPGDLLYLPPKIGHFGISIGQSVTWSIGYRMPQINGLLDDFTHTVIEKVSPQLRLEDPAFPIEEEGYLSGRAITQFKQQLEQHLQYDDEHFARWFSRALTAPRSLEGHQPLVTTYRIADLSTLIESEAELELNPHLVALYRKRGEDYLLYLGGEEFSLPKQAAPLIYGICQEGQLTAGVLRQIIAIDGLKELIISWVNLGYLHDYRYLEEEREEC